MGSAVVIDYIIATGEALDGWTTLDLDTGITYTGNGDGDAQGFKMACTSSPKINEFSLQSKNIWIHLSLRLIATQWYEQEMGFCRAIRHGTGTSCTWTFWLLHQQ